MRQPPSGFLRFLLGVLAFFCISMVEAEDPYRFYNWVVQYGTISPLGVKQRGILINGQFPGPEINVITNENVIVNVINKLDEPILFTWNGIKQRKSSWTDGVLGTNCPILPNTNWTYRMQMKDQIGTYSYFLSTQLHRAAGGYGALNIIRRSVIPLPYPEPSAVYTLIVSDWWNTDHKQLQKQLDTGKPFPSPKGLLINGRLNSVTFTGKQGSTYMFRVSNVGMTTSINFRIQNHKLKLVEVEGSHTMQDQYDSLDIHVGQSAGFLVTLNADVKDYYIVASSRFVKPYMTASAILHYDGSVTKVPGKLPDPPAGQYHWSMRQARTIRWNLTANAARPNPQGSYHYGTIPIVRTLVLENTKENISGITRYALNKVSYVNPTTPLKLADWLNIPGVFTLNAIKDTPPAGPAVHGVSVFGLELHDYVEIIFQNNEKTLQSYHLDGQDFWAVGYGGGVWDSTLRKKYNLVDATTRYTVQVYPNSWTAILVSLDNKGMWNLRSSVWPRNYLGQQVYLRVWNNEHSLYTENDMPPDTLLCGKAKLS
ncbi:PREDICTED: L-ascorbate oxidase homolog [Ipomoea nil]|uniref:L-ascorbate oxidase homolog n=1 Tax=Ipomoea nil TaxID=35883 RepID=UPI0009018F05|nr:PREDICTED: L-ascorbate oxidase homolog [Ipomoea nil]